MKLIKSGFFLIAFFMVQLALGQGSKEMIQAIKNMNMAEIETFLQDKIEFCIQEDQQILPKAIASKKFKTFLQTNKPVSLEALHSGTSKDKTTQYKVVKMVSAQGTFRIFIYSEGEIRPNSVKEIRIDTF